MIPMNNITAYYTSIDSPMREFAKLYDDDMASELTIDILYKGACLKLGMEEWSDWPYCPTKFKCAAILAAYDLTNEELFNEPIVTIAKKCIGMNVKASPIKKDIFEKLLMHEGFSKVVWVNDASTDAVFKTCGEIDRKISTKRDTNLITITAKFYSNKEKDNYMSNDKFSWNEENQMLMINKWIYDVYVLDSDRLEYYDLFLYIRRLRSVRW
jgi:hypothetical protein